MPDGELLIDPAFIFSTPIVDGSATWSLPLPPDPALAGLTAYAQCVAVDSMGGPLAWSNGLVLIVQP